MQNHNNAVYDFDKECPCLPAIAWIFVVVALVPHLLGLMGSAVLTMISSCACFPASMGPLAIVHAHLLTSRLGFTSHMSWISAVTFSLVWSAFLCCSWQRNKAITLSVGAFSFIASMVWIWQLFAPLS